MIKKLKIKIIALSMASLFLLLNLIVTGLNLLNYNALIKDADMILSLLSQNKGMFPDFDPNKKQPMPFEFSPELPHESRYFSVLLDKDGSVILTDTGKIAAIDTKAAVQYAQEVISDNKEHGFKDKYRYNITVENTGTRITFLDCGRKIDDFYNYLFTSILMALSGFAIVFVIFVFISGKIIKPIAESYEKQKRFITDAGHEIKTPLTIISANVDVLEMDIGKNECLEDISKQAKKLKELTENLIMLTRMEETQESIPKLSIPLSEIIESTANDFKPLAISQNKELEINIQPMLSISGNSQAIEQLTSILLDNALKYSPKNSVIKIELIKQNKNIVFSVTNEAVNGIDSDSISKIFDRFYRTDVSRNSETGGHGIGLSVAKAIVKAHNGKIFARVFKNSCFCITTTFPI